MIYRVLIPSIHHSGQHDLSMTNGSFEFMRFSRARLFRERCTICPPPTAPRDGSLRCPGLQRPDDTDESEGDEDDVDPQSPSFSIEILDDQGATSRIVYEKGSVMAPPLRVQLMKGKRLNKRLYNDTWEPINPSLRTPDNTISP